MVLFVKGVLVTEFEHFLNRKITKYKEIKQKTFQNQGH